MIQTTLIQRLIYYQCFLMFWSKTHLTLEETNSADNFNGSLERIRYVIVFILNVTFKILNYVDILYVQVWMTNQWIYWWRNSYCINAGLTYICLTCLLSLNFRMILMLRKFLLTLPLLADVAFNSLEHEPLQQLLLYPNLKHVGVVGINPTLSVLFHWSLSQSKIINI